MDRVAKMARVAKTARMAKLDRVAEINTGHKGLKVQTGLFGQFGHIDPNYQNGSKVQNAQKGENGHNSQKV